MGKVAKYHTACDKCGSSDAKNVYEAGDGYCFSCGAFFPAPGGEMTAAKNIKVTPTTPSVKEDIDEIKKYAIKGISERGIKKEVCEFFKVRSSTGEDGDVDAHYYPYGENSFKKRLLPKDFVWVGKSQHLFGKELFNEGGKRIVVTEGEIDALSVAQSMLDHYKKIYPVVALPNSKDHKGVIENRNWFRSFDEVILFLDSDEPGQNATTALAKIIGYDKVKVVKHPSDCKDANDILVKYGKDFVNRHIWDAVPYSPVGILGKDELWKLLAEYNNIESVPYPECINSLNEKLKGMRLGEITLFTSGTGSGKSTLMREVILDLLERTTDRIGIISLEEHPAETSRKLAGMALNRNPAAEEIPLDELKEGFDKIFGEDRILVLDHQGSAADNTIIDNLEYMAIVGCKYLIVDHITILVSEGAEGKTGNEAIDLMMNNLLRLVKKHNVWIGLVSHLRKTMSGKAFEEGELPNMDDIKGSGSIKQISFDIVAFARNMTAPEEAVRNEIKMRVLKCRYTGLTGDVAGAFYDYNTGRLCALDAFPITSMFDI